MEPVSSLYLSNKYDAGGGGQGGRTLDDVQAGAVVTVGILVHVHRGIAINQNERAIAHKSAHQIPYTENFDRTYPLARLRR
jgi:hypothetical protein